MSSTFIDFIMSINAVDPIQRNKGTFITFYLLCAFQGTQKCFTRDK